MWCWSHRVDSRVETEFSSFADIEMSWDFLQLLIWTSQSVVGWVTKSVASLPQRVILPNLINDDAVVNINKNSSAPKFCVVYLKICHVSDRMKLARAGEVGTQNLHRLLHWFCFFLSIANDFLSFSLASMFYSHIHSFSKITYTHTRTLTLDFVLLKLFYLYFLQRPVGTLGGFAFFSFLFKHSFFFCSYQIDFLCKHSTKHLPSTFARFFCR